MRILLFIALLGCWLPLRAQTPEQWWLPETRPGFRYLEPTLHPVPGGMVCMVVGDSVQGQWTKNVWKQLSFHRIDENGSLQSFETKVIGPYAQDDLFGESGFFDYTVGFTGSGGILLASTYWTYNYSCLGGDFGTAGRLRLDSFWQNGFRNVGEFPSARNPVLLSVSAGEAWLAFEKVETIEQPPDTLDMRYRARIVVAHVSADNTLMESRDLGEGYDPKLVERSDGRVFVLFRTSEHSSSLSGIGLALHAVDQSGEGEIRLAEGLRRRATYDHLGLQLVASLDQQLTVAVGSSDSIAVFQIDSDLSVERTGKSVASLTYGYQLLTDQGGNPVILWRRKYGLPLSWSSMENGRMFGTIRSIPGTERLGDDWSADVGPYDRLALTAWEWSSLSFRFYANITADGSPSRILFVPADSIRDTRSWSLNSDGTLWSGFLRRDSFGHPVRMGLYRVRDLSLAVPEPPSLPVTTELVGSYPNPFISTSTIQITLSSEMPVTLVVTDALGRELRRVSDGEMLPAGKHAFPFNAAGLSPGIYFLRMKAADQTAFGKMILAR